MPFSRASHLFAGLRSDATGITIIGVATLARGISYLPQYVDDSRSPAHWLEGLFAPSVWAWAWIVAGALCIVASRFPTFVSAPFGVALALHAAWGLSFLIGWIVGDTSRGYVSAISYAAIVALTLWGMSRGTYKSETDVTI